MTAGPSSQQPWSGGRFGAAECVLAPNASPWTLDGTNTWLLIGDGVSIVIDPGPLGGGHRERILDSADRHDAPITGIVLTHGHIDHSEGARELGEHLGVGVRALDPMHRLGGEGLVEGDRIEPRRQIAALVRGARLEQHRMALRRSRHGQRAVHQEMLAVVIDLVQAVGHAKVTVAVDGQGGVVSRVE